MGRNIAGYEIVGYTPPGVNCFYSPPPGAFWWDGAWRVREGVRTPPASGMPDRRTRI